MPVRPDDRAAGREVGALDVLHQARRRRSPGRRCRRPSRRSTSPRLCGGMFVAMPTAMPAEPLTSRFGKRAGSTSGSFSRAVVVGPEVDRVRVDVAQHLGGDPREARLRVAHGRRRVVVDRAEVALAVDQRVALREVLRQAHERVVDRGVAVRVERAHHVADDARALAVRAVRLEARLVHRVEHAAVHRLEAVAHVGQRAAHDHAHRVVEVATTASPPRARAARCCRL